MTPPPPFLIDMKRKRDPPTLDCGKGEEKEQEKQPHQILKSDPRAIEGKNTLPEESLQKIATNVTETPEERKGKREKPFAVKADPLVIIKKELPDTNPKKMIDSQDETSLPRIESCPTSLVLLETKQGEASFKSTESGNNSPKKLLRTEEPSEVHPKFECPDDVDPDRYLQLLVGANLGFEPQVKRALSLPGGFFLKPTAEQLASYSIELIEVVRENRLEEMKKMYATGEVDFQCSNRFGESLIHMACRRGYTDMVRFLIKEAGVSIRVCDDCGRTPFHDALWNRQPAPEIVDLLVEEDPVLFFVADKRGHTPFQYSRQEHQGLWKKFLLERRTRLCSEAETLKQVFT